MVIANDSFAALLDKEFATENLKFYLAVDHFRRTFDSFAEITTKRLREAAQVIFDTYIADDAKHMINITNDTKKKLVKAFASENQLEVNQWTFVESQNAILKLMYTDNFKRYLDTEEGRFVFSQFYSEEKEKERENAKLMALSEKSEKSTKPGTLASEKSEPKSAKPGTLSSESKNAKSSKSGKD